MFIIEHEFEATVITMMDDEGRDRHEDVRVSIHEDKAVFEQADEQTGEVKTITLSSVQLNDFFASLHLPEGAYSKEA